MPRIRANPGSPVVNSRVWIDGTEIAGVTRFECRGSVGDGRALVVLELYAREVEIEGIEDAALVQVLRFPVRQADGQTVMLSARVRSCRACGESFVGAADGLDAGLCERCGS